MSASTAALVRYVPIEPKLLPRTRLRYRAGIAMELLEVRRVLSAAIHGVIEAPEDSADPAIVVDDGGGEIGCVVDNFVGDGGDEEGDPTIYETFMVEDGIDLGEDGGGDAGVDDSGVDWPEGWGWSLDRLPTQDEIDAANNGDDLGGLWVPVRYFGGVADDGLATEDDGSTDEGWGEDGGWTDGGGDDENWEDVSTDDAGGDGEVWADGEVILEKGEGGFDPRVIFFNMAGGPVAANQRGPTSADAGESSSAGGEAAQAGGAPTPVAFGSVLGSDALLLGKLKSSVTADQDSDLPFMN